MEFAFTQEQEMIRDTAASFLKDASTSAAIRSAMASDLGYSPDLWQRICTDMYWQALHIPEEYGGMGLGYVELVAVLEQMGRYLLCSPYLATVAMATNALLIAGTDDQKTEILPQLIEGKTATLAFNGGSNLWNAEAITATYRRDGNDLILSGQYRYVLDGHSADYLIIAAREEASSGENGVSLFVCQADSDGIQRSLLPTMDQSRRQAAIELTDLRLPAESIMVELATAAKA